MRTKLWADGSSKSGFGGWACFIETPDAKAYSFSGYEFKTTNNRMELTAAIEGLKSQSELAPLKLILDSQYVLYGITRYIVNWKRNGWINSSSMPIKNRDLWEELDELVQGRDLEWQWTKGHSNSRGNNEADRLALEARKLAESFITYEPV